MFMSSMLSPVHIHLLLAFSYFTLASLGSFPHQCLQEKMFVRQYFCSLGLQEKNKDSESAGVGSLLSSTRQLIPCWKTHLVHIKRAEHLLDVLVGLWIQPSKPKELLKFMLRQLSRRTLCHEFLVPVVDLDSL